MEEKINAITMDNREETTPTTQSPEQRILEQLAEHLQILSENLVKSCQLLPKIRGDKRAWLFKALAAECREIGEIALATEDGLVRLSHLPPLCQNGVTDK